jgi:hypothetical protein
MAIVKQVLSQNMVTYDIDKCDETMGAWLVQILNMRIQAAGFTRLPKRKLRLALTLREKQDPEQEMTTALEFMERKLTALQTQ